METMSSLSLFNETPTALDAINVAKVVTGIVIFFLGGKYGYTPRTTMYTGIHVSYLCWWFLEQALFPPFTNRFSNEVGVGDWVFILTVIGAFFAFPAVNAFRNKNPVPHTAVSVACIVLFCLGCLVNAMADVQMHTTKELRKGLVTEGIFRLCQNPNWLGDYMRYGSFCLLSGRVPSFIVLGCVMSLNFLSLQDPAAKGGMVDRYGKAYLQWVDQVPNKIFPNLNSNTYLIAGGIVAIWAATFAFGKVFADKRLQVTKSKTV